MGKGLKNRAKGMVRLLVAQYILGMLVAVFGSDDPSKRTVFDSIILFSHVICGVLLLIGASFVLYTVSKSGEKQFSKSAVGGFVSVLAAFVTGFATMALHDTASGIASLIMAISFLGAFANYLSLLFSLNKEKSAVAGA